MLNVNDRINTGEKYEEENEFTESLLDYFEEQTKIANALNKYVDELEEQKALQSIDKIYSSNELEKVNN